MSIPLRFRYRVFPYSVRAGRMSRRLGILTSWPLCLVYAFVCVGVSYMIIISSDVAQGAATTLAFASLLPLCVAIQLVKCYVNRKIDRTAYEDLRKLQEIDPDRFMYYVNRYHPPV